MAELWGVAVAAVTAAAYGQHRVLNGGVYAAVMKLTSIRTFEALERRVASEILHWLVMVAWHIFIKILL